MQGSRQPRVKICCISNEQEAQMAIQAGASAIGLVGHMPSGPGIITDEEILAIAQNIPPFLSLRFCSPARPMRQPSFTINNG